MAIHTASVFTKVFMHSKQPAIYIMANKKRGTIYTGVTSNLPGRSYQHRESVVDGFTKKYGCTLLVYYEACDTMEQAILREKQIKSWKRIKKLSLIETMNPEWRDLYASLF